MKMCVLGSGFKGQGSGSGVQGFGFWAQGLGSEWRMLSKTSSVRACHPRRPPKDPNSISLVQVDPPYSNSP